MSTDLKNRLEDARMELEELRFELQSDEEALEGARAATRRRLEDLFDFEMHSYNDVFPAISKLDGLLTKARQAHHRRNETKKKVDGKLADLRRLRAGEPPGRPL